MQRQTFIGLKTAGSGTRSFERNYVRRWKKFTIEVTWLVVIGGSPIDCQSPI